MPIDKEEFENGKLHSKVEEEITTFLKERPKRAFTSQEIMEGDGLIQNHQISMI